jgi:pyruvate,orthophosphate dikinase
MSRDDTPSFMPYYIANGIVTDDPFKTIDEHGVAYLVNKAAVDGRAANANIHIGCVRMRTCVPVDDDVTDSICGEHGGDPRSIDIFERIGLDYVSCSPTRVPVARIAAAQVICSLL